MFAPAYQASADETSNSPFMRNRITGHEDSMSVWAPGVDAMGDGSDRLVTLDVNPASARHGKLIDTESVGRPGEANQMMFGANAIKAADEPADDTGRARVRRLDAEDGLPGGVLRLSERGHVSPTRVLVLPLCRQARERPCEVPVEWMLWTSAPIEGFEQALAALHGYARPWGASGSSTAPSKSGLRIEDRPLVSSDNWHQCLALDRVVAWRIEHLERLPRRHAETPAGVVLEERNCRVLAACCQDNGRSIDALFVAA